MLVYEVDLALAFAVLLFLSSNTAQHRGEFGGKSYSQASEQTQSLVVGQMERRGQSHTP